MPHSSVPSSAITATLTTAGYAAVLVATWGQTDDHGVHLPFVGWQWALPVGSLTAVALRRLFPWTTLLAMLAIEYCVRAADVASDPFGTAILLGSMATNRGTGSLVAASAVTFSALALSVPLIGRSVSGLVVCCLFAAAGVALGVLLRRGRRQHVRLLRLAVLERKRRTALEHSELRAALARDVHDVLTNALTVIARLADAIELDDALRPATRDLSQLVGRTARSGLDDVHVFVRGNQDASDDRSTLTSIARSIRASGVEVQLHEEGVPADPRARWLVTRVVQEATTNALKHASPTSIRISVRHPDDRSAGWIHVENDGVHDDRPAPSDSRPGFGLDGLQARIRSSGGTFVAGAAAADGCWALHATLPQTTSDRAGLSTSTPS